MGEENLISQVKAALRALGAKPRKSRGQNFLVDPNALDEIVAFAGISAQERLLEVGPGLGVLTERLREATSRVVAVELEEQFVPFLSNRLPGLELIHANVLDLNISDYLDEGEEELAVVSNVPYSVSTDVCLWILKNRAHISRACLLLQKEFAERLAAEPGSKAYGSLTVFRNLYADAELGPEVPGTSFYPKAKVTSRLIRLIPLEKPRVEVPSEEFFEKVVRASFATRRKTLLNCLTSAAFLPSKDETRALLESIEIDPTRRAETLSLEEFATLANEISETI